MKVLEYGDNCPHCKVSLIGTPIPKYEHRDDCEEQKDKWEALGYGRSCLCLPYGDATHFRREIGYETDVYDGVLYWVCPDCNMAWVRFLEGNLGQQSAEHVNAHNLKVANAQ